MAFHVKPSLWDLNDLLAGLRKLAEIIARSPATDTWYDGSDLLDGAQYLRRIEIHHEAVVMAYVVWMPDTLCGDLGRCLQPAGHHPMTLHADALSKWSTRFPGRHRINAGQPWR